jgi:hypothetical protein
MSSASNARGLYAAAVALASAACAPESAQKRNDGDAGTTANDASSSIARPTESSGDAGSKTESSGGGKPVVPPTEATELPKACGGVQGTFASATTISWLLASGHQKYVVRPGQLFTATSEPTFYSTTFPPIVEGDLVRGGPSQSMSSSASGPFNSSAVRSAYGFARAAFPTTEVGFGEFGWSQLIETFFDVAAAAPAPSGAVRIAHASKSTSQPAWTLSNVRRSLSAQVNDDDRYVSEVQTGRGVGWVFALSFDHECKASAFDALATENALGFLKPLGARPRKELSDFLVANAAVMTISVFHTGAEDAAVKAALSSSTCSPVDLDACDATMKSLEDALDALLAQAGPSDADYASIVDGTSKAWPIARVRVEEVPKP